MGNGCWSVSSGEICHQKLFLSLLKGIGSDKVDLSEKFVFVFGLILLSSLNQKRGVTVHLHLKHPLPESNCRQYIIVM